MSDKHHHKHGHKHRHKHGHKHKRKRHSRPNYTKHKENSIDTKHTEHNIDTKHKNSVDINQDKEFDIIAKNIWKGAHGRIQLVRRRSDNKVLVWKRPRSLSWIHINSFSQEIQKSKIWRRIGVSDINIYWHKDKMSIIKDYIEGPTLKEMLKKNPEFFSCSSKPLKELGKFVKKLVKSDIFIGDVNKQNIIYDENRDKWQLIDSSHIYQDIFPDVKGKYKYYLVKSWSKSLNSKKEIHAMEKFLDEYCK